MSSILPGNSTQVGLLLPEVMQKASPSREHPGGSGLSRGPVVSRERGNCSWDKHLVHSRGGKSAGSKLNRSGFKSALGKPLTLSELTFLIYVKLGVL